jgi:hypothetical protein
MPWRRTTQSNQLCTLLTEPVRAKTTQEIKKRRHMMVLGYSSLVQKRDQTNVVKNLSSQFKIWMCSNNPLFPTSAQVGLKEIRLQLNNHLEVLFLFEPRQIVVQNTIGHWGDWQKLGQFLLQWCISYLLNYFAVIGTIWRATRQERRQTAAGKCHLYPLIGVHPDSSPFNF